jgi:hypothetical protein
MEQPDQFASGRIASGNIRCGTGGGRRTTAARGNCDCGEQVDYFFAFRAGRKFYITQTSNE